jgi:ABC-type branched-subunit amino acid transport system ATPase component
VNGSGDGRLLETIGVTKAFGGLLAVADVSFHIPERSIVSIIGPNGAGKTTFFNMLTGLYKPSGGRILFEGKDITGKRPDRILRLDGRRARPHEGRPVRIDPAPAVGAAGGARGAGEGA